jgi:hypothetical protein
MRFFDCASRIARVLQRSIRAADALCNGAAKIMKFAGAPSQAQALFNLD